MRREPVSCDGGALIENLLEEMTVTILARPAEECYHICSFLWRTRVDRVKMYLRVNPHQVHILDGTNWS